jgi:hypothetical protein
MDYERKELSSSTMAVQIREPELNGAVWAVMFDGIPKRGGE